MQVKRTMLTTLELMKKNNVQLFKNFPVQNKKALRPLTQQVSTLPSVLPSTPWWSGKSRWQWKTKTAEPGRRKHYGCQWWCGKSVKRGRGQRRWSSILGRQNQRGSISARHEETQWQFKSQLCNTQWRSTARPILYSSWRKFSRGMKYFTYHYWTEHEAQTQCNLKTLHCPPG